MKPDTCDVGFKEWAGICNALAAGKQAIILRKGGIDESAGPGIFVPEHSSFWLYPTRLHESQQGLREVVPDELGIASAPPGTVPVSALAVAQTMGRLEDESSLEGLEDFHVWTEETVYKRFHYRSPGLWVLALRVFKRDTPYILGVTTEQEGCKTWVPLGRPLSTEGTKPVMDDNAWLHLKLGLKSLLK